MSVLHQNASPQSWTPTSFGDIGVAASDDIATIRQGMPASIAKAHLQSFHLPRIDIIEALALSPQLNGPESEADFRLPADQTERVLGLVRLLGLLDDMIADCGDGTEFDAAQWLSLWLITPLPALGGRKPITFLDTMTGQSIIMRLLGQMGSGAYA